MQKVSYEALYESIESCKTNIELASKFPRYRSTIACQILAEIQSQLDDIIQVCDEMAGDGHKLFASLATRARIFFYKIDDVVSSFDAN